MQMHVGVTVGNAIEAIGMAAETIDMDTERVQCHVQDVIMIEVAVPMIAIAAVTLLSIEGEKGDMAPAGKPGAEMQEDVDLAALVTVQSIHKAAIIGVVIRHGMGHLVNLPAALALLSIGLLPLKTLICQARPSRNMNTSELKISKCSKSKLASSCGSKCGSRQRQSSSVLLSNT